MYQDKKGHFTNEENDGGDCQHKTKEYRQNTPHSEISKRQRIKELSLMSKEEFFGVEFKGFKGKDAIDKLLKEKQGHVKAAFHREEIGDIDLVWGHEFSGLKHVILRRDEQKETGEGTITGLEMAKKIPEIIENGEINDKHGNISIIYQKYKVGINPTYDGIKVNWLVTAMEILK